MIWLLAACSLEPEPLPAAVQAAEADALMAEAVHPPMVQLVYDYAFLPEVQAKEQRVRIAIWLQYMEFNPYQLQTLREAWESAQTEHARIESEQASIVASYEGEIGAAYDAMWNELQAGATLQDPALLAAGAPLAEARLHHDREKALLELRLQGVRDVQSAAEPFLRSLTKEQEAKLSDALIFLRHRLDPYANPGDFNALIGTVFSPGDYATLTRGTFDPEGDQWDLAGLWSEEADREEGVPVFPDVRRGLLVYLILLEPTLPEAIAVVEATSGVEPIGPAGGDPMQPDPNNPVVPDAPEPAPEGTPQ
jgi:hypothetical protein